MLISLSMNRMTYARVVGLDEGNLDAFFLEEALGLGEVKRGVVRRGVPTILSASFFLAPVSQTVPTSWSGT